MHGVSSASTATSHCPGATSERRGARPRPAQSGHFRWSTFMCPVARTSFLEHTRRHGHTRRHQTVTRCYRNGTVQQRDDPARHRVGWPRCRGGRRACRGGRGHVCERVACQRFDAGCGSHPQRRARRRWLDQDVERPARRDLGLSPAQRRRPARHRRHQRNAVRRHPVGDGSRPGTTYRSRRASGGAADRRPLRDRRRTSLEADFSARWRRCRSRSAPDELASAADPYRRGELDPFAAPATFADCQPDEAAQPDAEPVAESGAEFEQLHSVTVTHTD